MYNINYKDKYNKYKGKYILKKIIKKQIGGNYSYKIDIDMFYDTLVENIRLNIKEMLII
jgi:hypothetical protein